MEPRGFLGVLARDCLVGLGGLGGGEAEDAVAGEDLLAVEPALGDFKGIAQVHKGAAGGGFVQGLEVVDFADHSGGIDVGDRKRDEGTTHPKAERAGLAKDKEHSGAFGQVGPSHQPGDALVGFVGDLHLDGVGPDLQPDGWQGSLRYGVGRAGGEAKVKACDQSQREGVPGLVVAGRRCGVRGGHGGSNNSSRRARTFFFSGSNLDCY